MSDGTGAAVMAWLRADARRFDLAVAIVTISLGYALGVGTPDEHDFGPIDAVAGVLAFVLLALRSRWPWALFGVAAVSSAAFVAAYQRPTLLVFAALVLLSTVCVRLERWPAVGLGAASAIGLYAIGVRINDTDDYGDARAVIFIAWTALAVGVADAVRSWRRAQEAADAQLRSALLATEAQTRQYVSEERLTIARELHDLLAHNLSVMNVQTGAALHLLRNDPDGAEQSLVAARDAGRNVLDELRGLLSVLRHDDGDETLTSSLPTLDQLPDLVETMRSAGLDVRWTRGGSARPLAPAVSLASYRIVQEALTNAAKHGPGVVDLATGWEADRLTIRVANPLSATAVDHLSGAAVGTGGGHGLIGMRERAVANGGRLTAGETAGSFVVEAWLPATVDREVVE
ncbi:MAG: histidine kinase [Actinomycetota bacterium]